MLDATMNLNPISPFLEKHGFLMLDGGLATEMEKQGADLDDELWSAKCLIDAPELIRQVHADFLAAGADVIASASYQANFAGFARAGYGTALAERLMRLSVDLAVLARETFWADYGNHRGRLRPLVAASIGPYGASLHNGSEYHGRYGIGKRALLDFHRPRMELLADTDADLFAFETIPSQFEAETLLELLEDFPEMPAWLSFSCRNGAQVSHGEQYSICAGLADQSEQTAGVGVNCTSPRHISQLLKCAVNIQTTLAVYPNSGEHWNAAEQIWAGEVCGDWPVNDWYDQGARLIGGCCRTSTEDITIMRASLTAHVNES